MAVITISRQLGSGGDEIARRVGNTLGYRLFDKQMIEDAAREAGLLEHEIIDLSEDNYPVHTFLDRLFGTMATGALVGFGGADGIFMLEASEQMQVNEEGSFELVKKAVTTACSVGNLIVVGRGGQLLLKDQSGCLHVRIEALLETRVGRVKEQLQSKGIRDASATRLTNGDLERQARDLIERRDRASADYIHNFFHARLDDPSLYHVVLNTSKLSLEQAVQVIVYMVHQLQPAGQEVGQI